MKYFYIFILTLILISYNEKKGYSGQLGIRTGNISDSECMEAIKNGTTISSVSEKVELVKSEYTMGVNRVLYKEFIYRISFVFAEPNSPTDIEHLVCTQKTELSNE